MLLKIQIQTKCASATTADVNKYDSAYFGSSPAVSNHEINPSLEFGFSDGGCILRTFSNRAATLLWFGKFGLVSAPDFLCFHGFSFPPPLRYIYYYLLY